MLITACAAATIINWTNTWNKRDTQAFSRAQDVCASEEYGYSCLKIFLKKEELVYNAICGEDNESRRTKHNKQVQDSSN